MEMAHNVSIPELTEAITARLVAQWEAWKNQDAASNNAIIAVTSILSGPMAPVP